MLRQPALAWNNPTSTTARVCKRRHVRRRWLKTDLRLQEPVAGFWGILSGEFGTRRDGDVGIDNSCFELLQHFDGSATLGLWWVFALSAMDAVGMLARGLLSLVSLTS